jgi:hypothetical protein
LSCYDSIIRWDPRVCRLALAVEARHACIMTVCVRDPDAPRPDDDRKRLRRDLQCVRRLLHVVDGNQSPLVAGARAFSKALAAHGDMPPEEPLPEIDAMNAVIRQALRAELPPPPAASEDWARRASRIASQPWIGSAVWECPWHWLPLVERAAIQADAWLRHSAALDEAQTTKLVRINGNLEWHGSMSDELRAITRFSCLASEQVCLVCGGEGALRWRGKRWLSLCDTHECMVWDAARAIARPPAASQRRRSA